MAFTYSKFFLYCLLLFAFNKLSAQSPTIQAFDADSNIAIFADNTSTIRIFDTQKNTELQSTKLSDKSSLLDSILISILQINNIKSDSLNSRIKTSIKHLRILNITILSDKILVGATFTTEYLKNYPKNNILIEFDKSLGRFKHYILFSKNKSLFYTFLPYYPLNFIHQDKFLIPIHTNNKIEIRAFQLMAGKSHKAILQDSVYATIKTTITPNLDAQFHTIVEPLILSVDNGLYKYYYEYPFPIFYKTTGQMGIFSDEFAYKKYIDSCQNNKDHKMFGLNATNLNFNLAISKFNQVVLCTSLQKNALISIHSIKEDKPIIEIQKIHFNDPVIEYSRFDISPINKFFKISGNNLIYLEQNGVSFSIQVIDI